MDEGIDDQRDRQTNWDEKSKKKRKKASTGKSFVAATYIILCLFFALVAYLIYFQIEKSQELLESPYNKRQDVTEEQITRGSIMATDGTLLAYTETDVQEGDRRVYPYGSLFAQTVGYSDYGTSGLESSENYYLTTSHANLMEQVQKNLNEEKSVGDSVVTSFRVDLQQTARNALGDNKGAVLVCDASTGQILVDVSSPDFDPSTVSENWENLVADEEGSPFINRATQGLYSPGSTFKIVTTLAFLRQFGTLDTFAYECTGEYTADGYTIHCADGNVHGFQTYSDVFANSCNCAFAYIASEMLDKSLLRDTAEQLKFNYDFDLELPSAISSFTMDATTSTPLAMQTAIGQGDTLATPLLMMAITQSIANGGVMMNPYYVREIQSQTGTIVKTYEPEAIGQVMSQEEAEILKNLMYGVVQNGTAQDLADLPYNIAGKTGTAQFGDVAEDKAHSWFVAFSNTGLSDIVVCVIVENGGNGIAPGTQVARAIFQAYYG